MKDDHYPTFGMSQECSQNELFSKVAEWLAKKCSKEFSITDESLIQDCLQLLCLKAFFARLLQHLNFIIFKLSKQFFSFIIKLGKKFESKTFLYSQTVIESIKMWMWM
jgi:hypothetical protein